MIPTTLCYLTRGDELLMLHRTKKVGDLNKDKYIGLGGHFEENESPEECMKREVKEECGLDVVSYKYRGLVTFVSDLYECEQMHLFTAELPSGDMIECDEGDLQIVKKSELKNLNLWEGDYIFLSLLYEDVPFFSLKLSYTGDHLDEAILNGEICHKEDYII